MSSLTRFLCHIHGSSSFYVVSLLPTVSLLVVFLSLLCCFFLCIVFLLCRFLYCIASSYCFAVLLTPDTSLTPAALPPLLFLLLFHSFIFLFLIEVTMMK